MTWRRGLYGAMVAATALIVLPSTGQTQGSPNQETGDRRTFNIPAQPLAAALAGFGRQSGMHVSADAALIERVGSPGVSGQLTSAEALSRLLTGTKLSFRMTGGNTAILTADPTPSPTDGAIGLGPVTVLGSRAPNVPMSNVPSTITFIDRDRIEKETPTAPRIEDVLSRTVPGFNPTNQGVRQIRGRTAQVFVNGVPVNEQLRASSGSDLNLLPVDHLDTIEVARGANSAFGFGSPGGIIALSTPRARSETLTFNTKLRTSFNTSHPGGSFQHGFYQSAAQIIGPFDFHVGASLILDGLNYDADGKRAYDLKSPALFSMGKETLYNFDTSLGYNFNDVARIRLTAAAGRANVDRNYDSDFSGTYRRSQSTLAYFPAGNRNFRSFYTANLSFEHDDVFGSALKVEAFASRVHAVKFTDTGTDLERDQQTNQYRGVRLSVTTPLDALWKGASVTYGFDVLRDRYYRPNISQTTRQILTLFAPNVTLDSYAPYLQAQASFGDLRFNAGVRHEFYRGRVKTGTSTSGAGDIQGGDIGSFGLTLFNAGVVYALGPKREIYGSFSQGAEITQLGRAARDAGTASRIDPQPAKSNQYEIGVRQTGRAFNFSLAAFFTESDLMSSLQCRDPNAPCIPLREPRRFWGIEATADWTINDQWSVAAAASWQDGVRKPEGETRWRRIGSRDVPPFLGNLSVDYKPKAWWRNTVTLEYHAGRDPFGASTEFEEGRVSPVLLVHLGAAFDVGPGTLQIGIQNLFNRKYFSIPSQANNFGFSWIPDQGRRISLAYSMKW